MEDDLRPHAPGQLLQRLVANVELVQRRGRSEVLAGAGAEVVHGVHLDSPRQQRVYEVRSDEPRSAGDHRAHRPRIVGALAPRHRLSD